MKAAGAVQLCVHVRCSSRLHCARCPPTHAGEAGLGMAFTADVYAPVGSPFRPPPHSPLCVLTAATPSGSRKIAWRATHPECHASESHSMCT